MIYFPQLQTGAAVQFPLQRTAHLRTASCDFADGTVTRVADPGARILRWKLEYRGLIDEEWAKLASFFQQTRGRLQTFCFLDPFENLLSWSADPAKPVWTVAPAIQISAGAEDVFGGSTGFVFTNNGATTQRISQRLDIPGSGQYSWSMYIRDASDASCKMMAESGDGGSWMDVPAASGWQRVSMPCSIPGTSQTLTFGIDIQRGVSIRVCGLQVDAQPNPAKVRATRSRSGVLPLSRFDQDQLTLTSAGLNDHATTVHIISNLSL